MRHSRVSLVFRVIRSPTNIKQTAATSLVAVPAHASPPPNHSLKSTPTPLNIGSHFILGDTDSFASIAPIAHELSISTLIRALIRVVCASNGRRECVRKVLSKECAEHGKGGEYDADFKFHGRPGCSAGVIPNYVLSYGNDVECVELEYRC